MADGQGVIKPVLRRSETGSYPRLSIANSDTSLRAAIFDVDGVLLASPHERAWREALTGFADPIFFTTAIYQKQVAGKPRLAGARAALRALGVADVERQAPLYAARKQERLEQLIQLGPIVAFPDALRLVQAISALGWKMAVASSSMNANSMLQLVRLANDKPLLGLFNANLCGQTFQHGKPDPAIFLAAAAELAIEPIHCLVIEDAPAGIRAAHAGNMTALGIARSNDEATLAVAGADLVVDSLDDVDLAALAAGRCSRRFG
ncbi:HAD family phosphatase (plasmid) [Lichenicola cladoniae]|uniref:HAD family phosphatase n=1 Tax=Lichenicola cladoniae TaxID=1484109 RepID=A0A6M8HY64_9PROT|nr:HAD family phosphatase [Lichenicola cladoniae]NPD66788.1 HAD family phosphatase [Acetobacteraceae bacterium]QKE93514.1 HAD family phosphatase [Lichenicola cladoniae]